MKLDFDKIKENASRMDAGQRPGYKAQSVAPASQSPLNFEQVIANAKLRDEQSRVHAAPKPVGAPKPLVPKLPTYRSTLDGMADGAMPLSPFARKKLDDARLSPVRTKGLTAERDRLDARLTQSQNRINAGEGADVDGMKRDQYRINDLSRQLDTQKAERYEADLAGQRAVMERKAGPVSGAKLSPDRRTEDLLQTYPGYGPAPRDKSGVTDAARYLSDPEFRKAAKGRMKLGSTLDDALAPLDYMTETERNTLVSYVQAGDLQSAEQYKALLDRTLNARRQQKQSATMERTAREHPVLGTVNNLGSSLGSGFALAGTAGQAVKNLVTGKDEPTDYNSKWFRSAHAVNDTAQGLHRAAYDAAGGGTWGEIAAGAADMGLSLGQMVAKMPLGPAALPMMALTAGGQSSLGALERGASTGQALAYGTATGLVEALTEKLPLDALFDLAKTGKSGVKAVLGSVLKQMGSEASQEMVSELADNLADKAIMGTRSEYENYVAGLVSQGMDEGQARQAATKQYYLYNVAKAGLGGAVTGGVMAGGANIIGSIGNKNAQAPLKPNRLLTGKEQFEQSQMQNEQKNTAEAAVSPRYTVKRDVGGDTFIEIDANILDGKPQGDWASIVRNAIQSIFGEGLKLSRGTVLSNGKGRGEYSNGKYTRSLERTDPQMYADKMRAAVGSDGMVKYASDISLENPNHDRTDDIIGFNRGKINVSVKDSGKYGGDVLTAIYSDGKETFFDLNNIYRKDIKEAPPERYAAQDGFTQTGNASLTTNVAQAAPEVNTEDMQNGGKDAGINAKATEYSSRTLKRSVEKVAGILSVPKNASRETLLPILQTLSDSYLKNGTVDKGIVDGLFEAAYKNGMVIDDEYYRQYADLRNRLRTVPVSISDTDKSGIADYGAFRKSNMGKLNITKNGLPVDVAYMELSQSAPELFPTSISNPTDMLLKMAEVADSFRKIEADLDAYYGDDAENFKKYARHEFDGIVDGLLPELEKVKRYSEAVKQEQENVDKLLKVVESDLSENMVSEIGRRWTEKKKLHRAEAAAVRKNLLSPQDDRTVGRLLRGEITLDELPSGINVSGVREVYEAKKAVQDAMRPIALFNKHRKAALRAQADKMLEGSETWRDKAAGLLYSRETMERNIRYVVEDPARAQEIIDKYFTPVHENEAKRNKLKNELRDKARALNLSRKVNKGNQASEAAAVQFLGEAEDNISYLKERGRKDVERNGKNLEQWLSAKQEFIDSNSALDFDKVNGAVEAFREIYDGLFEQMNASRIRNGYEPVDYRRGYFPHFSEKGGDGLLNTFAAALGVKMEVQNLPTTINGITHTFRPGIRWSGNTLQRTGNSTVYDALEGFDMYVEGISDVIYHTDDIQRLRAFSDQMRYRASDEAIRARVDNVRENSELDELEKRAAIEEIYKDAPTALSNFVVELEEYTNLLANKKSRRDREVEGDFGRGIYNAAKALESRVAANMVAINPASWLTNFIPLTQGGAEVKSISLAAGMKDTLKAYLKDDGFVSRSSFLTNRRGSEPLVRDAMESLSAKAGKGMNIIDEFTADSLVRARYRDNVARGMAETTAMDEADGWAASVMADRSKGSLPTVFEARNPMTKLFTQFQVEVNNQLSHLYSDIPRQQKEKGAAALALVLLKFMVGAFLYNDIYEKIIGRRPALDPLGMLNETVGDTTGYKLPNAVDAGSELLHGRLPNFQTDKKSAAGAVAGAGGRIAEELPFVGGLLGGGRLPISSAIPNFATIVKAGTNLFAKDGNPDKQKAVIGKELAKPLYYVLPPFGGGQVKKAYEGIKAVLEGGVYSVDTKGREVMQYPVLNDSHALPTAATMARVAVFGKSSLPTAQTWVKSGFKGSSAAETAVYQGLIGMGTQRKAAYELVEELSGVDSGENGKPTMQAEYLHRKELRPEEKAVAYYGIIASDNERLLMDDMEQAGVPAGSAYEMLTSIKMAPAGGKRQKLAALDGTGAKSVEKYGAYYGLIASDEERETLDALKKSGIQDGTAYELLSAVGSVSGGEGEKDRKRAALLGVKGLTPSQKSGLGVSLVGDERILDYSSAESLTISTMPESTREKAKAAKKARISDKVFISAYEAQKGIMGDKDKNGETVELSAARKKKAAIDRAARGLTYAQKTTLYEMFGVSRKVWAELPGG